METDSSLADLLAIWPITESFARNAPVGDLINLSRSSLTLRSSLHGRLPEPNHEPAESRSRPSNVLSPSIGKHQTSDWAHLKSIAPFVCSSLSHTRGQKIKPCLYCSRPICDACIVRDSFKRPNAKTFQNRLRYFCKECWTEGRRSKGFRYPATDPGSDVAESKRQALEDEAQYIEADEFCDCTLKDNGWLCPQCKNDQNLSNLIPIRLSPVHSIECYGLDCKNLIQQDTPDKDRRRVCLWCEHPLRRQWGGEDRHAWNLKTWEARARNAENRSRDIEEYHRRRLESQRMTRQEMRGTTGSGDDVPAFVRHLDTINYRNWMPGNASPDPEAVYMSKNGYWRYHREFLLAIGKHCTGVKYTDINSVPVEAMSALTQSAALTYARLNQNMKHSDLGGWTVRKADESGHKTTCLTVLRARILHMHFTESKDSTEIAGILDDQFGVRLRATKLDSIIRYWLRKHEENSPPAFTEEASQGDNDKQLTFKELLSTSEEEDGSSVGEDSGNDSESGRGGGNGLHARNIDGMEERHIPPVNGTNLANGARAFEINDDDDNDTNMVQALDAGDENSDEPPPYGV